MNFLRYPLGQPFKILFSGKKACLGGGTSGGRLCTTAILVDIKEEMLHIFPLGNLRTIITHYICWNLSLMINYKKGHLEGIDSLFMDTLGIYD